MVLYSHGEAYPTILGLNGSTRVTKEALGYILGAATPTWDLFLRIDSLAEG